MTETGNLKEKFAAAKYETEIPYKQLVQCLHGFREEVETKICDDDKNCKKEKKFCPSKLQTEEMLNGLVTNQWQTGEVWGEILGNMFQATLEV